jgi:hypothetical protein
VEQWLRMRVHPIAIKIIEDHQDLPEDVMIPFRDQGKRLNLCQETIFTIATRT